MKILSKWTDLRKIFLNLVIIQALYTIFFYKQLGSGPSNCLYFQEFQLPNLLNGCLVVWPSKQTQRKKCPNTEFFLVRKSLFTQWNFKSIAVIFQHSSLTYCILPAKDQSSFYEIHSWHICINIKAFNRVTENSWTFWKHFQNVWNFILLPTEDYSALNVAQQSTFRRLVIYK